MARKQNFWYVMVMSQTGPAFVTYVDRLNKLAQWDKEGTPLELGKYWAEDLALGLNLNFNLAFAVCSKVELDKQPYLYDRGRFEWVLNKDEQADKEDVDDEISE